MSTAKIFSIWILEQFFQNVLLRLNYLLFLFDMSGSNLAKMCVKIDENYANLCFFLNKINWIQCLTNIMIQKQNQPDSSRWDFKMNVFVWLMSSRDDIVAQLKTDFLPFLSLSGRFWKFTDIFLSEEREPCHATSLCLRLFDQVWCGPKSARINLWIPFQKMFFSRHTFQNIVLFVLYLFYFIFIKK